MAHITGARLLVAAKENGDVDGDQLFPAVYLLLGFAFELSLKAAFLLRGGDRTLLAGSGKAIGHDLERALAFAQNAGFLFSSETLETVVGLLNPAHKGHWMRYDDMPPVVTLPKAQIAISELKQVVVDLYREYPDLLT